MPRPGLLADHVPASLGTCTDCRCDVGQFNITADLYGVPMANVNP